MTEARCRFRDPWQFGVSHVMGSSTGGACHAIATDVRLRNVKELDVSKGNRDEGRFDRIGMDSTALGIHRVLKDFSRDPLAWSN